MTLLLSPPHTVRNQIIPPRSQGHSGIIVG